MWGEYILAIALIFRTKKIARDYVKVLHLYPKRKNNET